MRHRNKSEYNETNTYYRSAASFHQLHVAKERAHLSLARESTWRAEKKEGALQDAQRALRVVRQKAPEWNIDPEKVGIMGFSAGGSLSASTSTLFSKRTYVPMDAADSLSCRPSFTMFIFELHIMPSGGHGYGLRPVNLAAKTWPQMAENWLN